MTPKIFPSLGFTSGVSRSRPQCQKIGKTCLARLSQSEAPTAKFTREKRDIRAEDHAVRALLILAKSSLGGIGFARHSKSYPSSLASAIKSDVAATPDSNKTLHRGY